MYNELKEVAETISKDSTFKKEFQNALQLQKQIAFSPEYELRISKKGEETTCEVDAYNKEEAGAIFLNACVGLLAGAKKLLDEPLDKLMLAVYGATKVNLEKKND